MNDEATLLRIEAMLVSLRDQIDHLTERVEARLDAHERRLPPLITKREVARREENRAAAEQ